MATAESEGGVEEESGATPPGIPAAEQEPGGESTGANPETPSGANGPSLGGPISTGNPLAGDGKVEVSAATIGRMLGLATASEIALVEKKLGLMASQLSSVSVRLEKVLNALQKTPSASDLERVDAQLASLRTLIKDALGQLGVEGDSGGSAPGGAGESAPAEN